MTFIEVALAITPKTVFCIHINSVTKDGTHNGQSDLTKNGYELTTTHPLKSFNGFIVFMHECAHAHLKHSYRETTTVSRSYLYEIEAWSQVKFWLDKYTVTHSKTWLRATIINALKNHVKMYGVKFEFH